MPQKTKDMRDSRNYNRGYFEGQRFAAKSGPESIYYTGFRKGFDDKIKSMAEEKAQD